MLPSKETVRSYIRQRRSLLTENEWKIKSNRVTEQLKGVLNLYPHAESFLFYYSINREPDITPLAKKLLKAGKRVAFPKVSGKEILPIEVSSLRELSPGRFGIPEPPLDFRRVLNQVDVVFVPGLAFDVYGFRVGYGGGFYDRFLKSFRTKARVGVCFSFQLFDRVPHDPFDVPVDYITTEKFWIRRKEWNQS